MPAMSASADDPHPPLSGLAGARILVVEDEYYLAADLVAALEDAGAQVIGPFGAMDQAEAPLASGAFDAALLDMNLRGEPAFPLAERLQEADVPFVIVSGYSGEALPPTLAEAPRLEKPIEAARAVKALAGLLAHRSEA
jgi:DNA-binding NtrC family response regulator